MIDDQEFFRNASKSPWILLAGMTVRRIHPDYLHIVDLAIAPDCAASAAQPQVQQQCPWLDAYTWSRI